MLKGENIVCISSIDWDFNWQGHQEIMTRLAASGNRILYIENTGVRPPFFRDIPRIISRLKNFKKGIKGIRQESENIYVYSPVVLPFPYSGLVQRINSRIMSGALKNWFEAVDFKNPVVWTFLPTGTSLKVIETIKNVKCLIYYCIDNFSASSRHARKILKDEAQFIKKADLVFVTSAGLYNYCAKHRKDVHVYPFGVNIDNFNSEEAARLPMPKDMAGIKNPIIGYIGAVQKWIDKGLIRSLAEAMPDYSFVFIGPLYTDIKEFSDFKNVYFLGAKKHKELPAYLKYFAVAIIPYRLTKYIENVYPTKLNEYLAMGKPVVSTDMPEIRQFNRINNNVITIAKNPAEFIVGLKKAVSGVDWDEAAKRVLVAKANSWDSRVEEMSILIEKKMRNKSLMKKPDWRHTLISTYRVYRRKMLTLAFVVFVGWFILFESSFLWFVASPLKIKDNPVKSDAIVVLAGGVGEIGRPGTSTVERARLSVELFKQGYAPCIIFSSGYTYKYKDTENMKTFALSMGVKQDKIILENKSASTYENVKLVSDILKKNGWTSILLVSSPYNMRRVDLTMRKNAKGIAVRYIPVENSFFYSAIASRYDQLKAILHEYIGIVYYYFKGYI